MLTQILIHIESFTADTNLYFCILTLFLLALIGVTALIIHIRNILDSIDKYIQGE